MKLRNRFILVGTGVIIFMIAAPLLVLFTQGYEIDWSNHQIVKTGTLIIKTLPTKSFVYLDTSKVSGSTPKTLRFLLPGNYNIRIEKENYQSWTKRLTIRPRLATWINEEREFITLFYNQPQSLNQIPVNFSSLSKDHRELAYIQNQTLHTYNINNQHTETFSNISEFHLSLTFAAQVSWNNAEQTLEYFQKNQSLPIPKESISRVETDESHLAYLSGNTLVSLEDSLPLTIDDSVSGFSIEGENLWYVQGHNLKQYNFRTQVKTIINADLPSSTTAQVIRGEGNIFLILDDSLFILNDTLEKIYTGVTFATWDDSYHQLLFANANEILTYSPQKKSVTLILRSISPINNPILNSYTGYIFFSNENKIKAIELDGRDHRNIYTILNLNQNHAQFVLSDTGDILTIFDNQTIESYRIR